MMAKKPTEGLINGIHIFNLPNVLGHFGNKY